MSRVGREAGSPGGWYHVMEMADKSLVFADIVTILADILQDLADIPVILADKR